MGRVKINSEKGKKPLYEQVVSQIREYISENNIRPGQKLPSIRVLAERYGTSEITVRASFRQLKDHGIVMSRGKSGFYLVNLNSNKTLAGIISLIMSHNIDIETNQYYLPMLMGLRKRLGEQFNLVICSHTSEMSACDPADYLDGHVPVGAVLLGPHRHESLKNFDRHNIPYVSLAGEIYQDISGDTVVSDDTGAVKMAFRKVVELGHKCIAYIGDIRVKSAFGISRRMLGVQQVLNELRGDVELITHFADGGDLLDGYDAMGILKKYPQFERITAIFAENDLLAIGAMRVLNELGIKVPDDISVVGGDDIEMAEYSNPPLATINAPSQLMGEKAGELLLRRFKQHDIEPQTIVLPGEFKLRASLSKRCVLK